MATSQFTDYTNPGFRVVIFLPHLLFFPGPWRKLHTGLGMDLVWSKHEAFRMGIKSFKEIQGMAREMFLQLTDK